MTFADLLHTWMYRYDLSHEGAAFKLRCTRMTIINWSSGTTIPTRNKIAHIARVTRIPRAEIAAAIGNTLAQP